MYRISKTFRFEAAHQLTSLPDTHKCSRLHGHSYTVELVLKSKTLDEHGFIKDYGDLFDFKQFIEDNFDHRNINTVMEMPTTAENIAHFLYFRACIFYPGLVERVRVSESLTSWAEYEK